MTSNRREALLFGAKVVGAQFGAAPLQCRAARGASAPCWQKAATDRRLSKLVAA